MDAAWLSSVVRFAMFRRFSVVVGCLLLGGRAAEASCDAAYTAERLGEDMAAMASSLQSRDLSSLGQAGGTLVAGLPCVDFPLAPMILGSVYRYAGLNAYYGGRDKEARGWFRSSLELDSTYDWDVSEIGIDDPIRAVFDEERAAASTEKVPMEGGVQLKAFTDARLTADGRALSKPSLTVGRPHLVQLISTTSGSAMNTWLIDGNALPEAVIEQPQAITPVSTGPALGSSTGVAVQRIERSRPPLKTPAIISGGVLMAAGVGMYAASFATRGSFDKASTLSDAESHRTVTNALVLGAGGALVAGAGLTYVGLMLDGGPGIHWSMRF